MALVSLLFLRHFAVIVKSWSVVPFGAIWTYNWYFEGKAESKRFKINVTGFDYR